MTCSISSGGASTTIASILLNPIALIIIIPIHENGSGHRKAPKGKKKPLHHAMHVEVFVFG